MGQRRVSGERGGGGERHSAEEGVVHQAALVLHEVAQHALEAQEQLHPRQQARQAHDRPRTRAQRAQGQEAAPRRAFNTLRHMRLTPCQSP